ncbi:MAG TPA: DUF368 domain-containing protein [Clostridiales bacterium]|nr:DUF368 domain-containing protein [Clostridiales bacterium]
MAYLKRILLGLIIGIAFITPGVSGGVLAAAIGVYEPAIFAVYNLRKKFLSSVAYLLPLAIGGGIGILLFSNIIKFVYGRWPFEVLYLFFGLVVGSIPSILKTANEKGFRARYLWVFLVAFLLVISTAVLEKITTSSIFEIEWNFLSGIIIGVVLAVGTVVPGISTSFILMYMGVYDDFLSAVAGLEVLRLIPVGIGFCIGVLPLVSLARYLFERYRGASYYGVLGFLTGSMVAVFPGVNRGAWFLADILLFVAGLIFSYVLLDLNKGKNNA